MSVFDARREAQTFVFDRLEREKGLRMTHEFKVFLLDEIERLLDMVVDGAVEEAVAIAEAEMDEKGEKETEEQVNKRIETIRAEAPKIVHRALARAREGVLAEKSTPDLDAVCKVAAEELEELYKEEMT